MTSFAGGAALPAPERDPSAVPRVVRELFQPTHVFPMRAVPEYGDGIGAARGHEGQDMFAPAGTALVAVADAVVIESGSSGGAGHYISIYDPRANRTYNYFHMLAPALAAAGERVSAGQQLGRLGCSGSCWGDHLHFEERTGRGTWGPVLDPMPFLQSLSSSRAG